MHAVNRSMVKRNAYVWKTESYINEKGKKRKRRGVSFGGRARIGSFYQFELESSTGHPKISKGEISKAFSPPPLPGENTRGIIVPSDPISSRDNSFPEDVELSRYESHWTLQLPPPLFSIPINQIPCFLPFLQNFSLPVSLNARDDRAKNSILETRVVKEKYGEVVVIQWRRERSHGRRDTRIVDRWIG